MIRPGWPASAVRTPGVATSEPERPPAPNEGAAADPTSGVAEPAVLPEEPEMAAVLEPEPIEPAAAPLVATTPAEAVAPIALIAAPTPAPPPVPAPGPAPAPAPASRVPRSIFYLELGYLVVLLGAAGAFLKWAAFRDVFPDPLGPIPLGVPWFGALGAVTISLYAIFRYSDSWDPTFEYSHIARPLTGAVVGIVGYLILASVINATGASGGVVQALGKPVSYVVAFLLGYREQSFRELIRKATDLLIFPGQPDKPTATTADETSTTNVPDTGR